MAMLPIWKNTPPQSYIDTSKCLLLVSAIHLAADTPVINFDPSSDGRLAYVPAY